MMKDRLKTLLLYAARTIKVKGPGTKLSRADLVRDSLRNAERRARKLRSFLLGREQSNATYNQLSYVNDWKDAICAAPELDVTTCDVSNLQQYWRLRSTIPNFPFIFILHSVTGDDMSLLRRTEHWFDRRKGKLIAFVGNEYDLLDEKLGFLRNVEAEFVCSQLPLASAQWLYEECRRSQVVEMPHALNPDIYNPKANSDRNCDIGFCGDKYSRIIGDNERDTIIDFFVRNGSKFGLNTDIRVNSRMNRIRWSTFLEGCRAIIGAESGSYYLDRRATIIEAAKSYLLQHPDASFEEVFDLFFRSPSTEHVSCKCISSRHFEPIGTKTCQILLEGNYNGILQPDTHYIEVKKDLSNIDDAIYRFKDSSYRQRMVDDTYEFVNDQHTYRHRVNSLIERIAA